MDTSKVNFHFLTRTEYNAMKSLKKIETKDLEFHELKKSQLGYDVYFRFKGEKTWFLRFLLDEDKHLTSIVYDDPKTVQFSDYIVLKDNKELNESLISFFDELKQLFHLKLRLLLI